MAKIDTSTIEGYTDMTPEEKIAALEAYDHHEDHTGYVKKDLFDKASSELAALKKASKPDAEKIATLETQIKELTEDKLRSEHKARFIGLGYDEELAASTADAMVKGDMETVFNNQKSFLEKHDKTIAAATMKNTPTPPAGGAANATNYQKLIDEAYARGDMATAVAYTAKLYESK